MFFEARQIAFYPFQTCSPVYFPPKVKKQIPSINRLSCFIFAWLCAFSLMLSADELKEGKVRYEAVDKTLNEVFSELKKVMPAERFEEMKKDQRAWVDYKTYMSDWVGGEKGQTSPDWWHMAASLTEDRIPYLKAWKGVGEDFVWPGVYKDGSGGTLYIQKKGDLLHFKVSVVRGPTYHVGHISGVLQVNDKRARFSDAGANDKDRGEAWLDLKLIDGQRIELEATNAKDYHGVRAYFDGIYLRVDAKGLIPNSEE